MDGCTAISFVNTVSWHCFCPSLHCLHCICESFHNGVTIHASALHCVLWQNLDKDSFDMRDKNDGWAAIPDSIWTTNVPYERKINMLSSTDNYFMIFFFFFLILRSLGLIFFLFLLTLYMGIDFLSSFNASRPFLHVVSEKDKNCELFLGHQSYNLKPQSILRALWRLVIKNSRLVAVN